jgi:putative Mg2+ transporter-C (MgtC) family protein
MIFSIPSDIAHILFSLLIGAVIGAEREYRSKSAGLRTMMLVSVGSCIFTLLSIHIGSPNNADRIAANIITGIGFLGAGVIFKEDNDKVTGITTATTIWAVAALGMAAGGGYIEIAGVATLIVLIILIGLIYVQEFIDKSNQLRSYKIVCPYQQETLKKYEEMFKEYKLKAFRGSQSKCENEIVGRWVVQGSVKNHEALVNALLQDNDIKEFDF